MTPIFKPETQKSLANLSLLCLSILSVLQYLKYLLNPPILSFSTACILYESTALSDLNDYNNHLTCSPSFCINCCKTFSTPQPGVITNLMTLLSLIKSMKSSLLPLGESLHLLSWLMCFKWHVQLDIFCALPLFPDSFLDTCRYTRATSLHSTFSSLNVTQFDLPFLCLATLFQISFALGKSPWTPYLVICSQTTLLHCNVIFLPSFFPAFFPPFLPPSLSFSLSFTLSSTEVLSPIQVLA